MYSDFEEISLRLYGKRFDGAKWRKGVVSIAEIVDKVALKLLANTVLSEDYRLHTTKQEIKENEAELDVKYSWQFENEWQHLQVKTNNIPSPYDENTETAFFLDRPYGYGKIDEKESNETEVSHSSWHTNKVHEYSIDVDFSRQFDPVFNILNNMVLHSVILAEGSTVKIHKSHRIPS
ncbi:DUF2071 domain-containing protein [Salinimicrobium flavum]|uniref:DUF2071 domain-containing protein n=1 Tax=Salinimicrobium flavum TaxID=1737065 RepID=A0ABW5IUX3_9FLAO